MNTIKGTILGFPRMGKQRELKQILESYWKGDIPIDTMLEQSTALRRKHLELLVDSGLDEIPVNDFSLYDHVLDTTVGFGIIPERYAPLKDDFARLYFAMARGERGENHNIRAMEMSKWFDTNYHYIVPEFNENTRFSAENIIQKISHSIKEAQTIIESKGASCSVRPVLPGPVSFLLLGKTSDKSKSIELLPPLLEEYSVLFKKLEELGIEKLQLDEPYLVFNLDERMRAAYREAYAYFNIQSSPIKIFLASYFDNLKQNLSLVSQLPVDTVHIDLVRSSMDVATELIKSVPSLSLGIIDGRNIWKSDLRKLLSYLEPILEKGAGKDCYISCSCSLLHCPFDLSTEDALDKEIVQWLAFSMQKLEEIRIIKTALREGKEAVATALDENQQAIESRKNSGKVHNVTVKERVQAISEEMTKHSNSYAQRKKLQKTALNLPLFPTTTIGSYPQTREIRSTRAAFKKGKISTEEYTRIMRKEIQKIVRFQEEVGLDMLVHGEPERNDMVEYFGENFDGFASTSNGWVQSYGSRCVKPPIIYGDLSRKSQITVDWISYAQSLTSKPMKGMLTGPVTILQWSFVRDDQPRSQTAYQIALLVRDEIKDLENAKIKVVQVDEPAIREGLPLQKSRHAEYLNWAVRSFRVATCGVKDETQIHTHMCYSEFNEIISSIAALDADVISIEASRSNMELLEAFKNFQYPNEIGPGVYDIHSPRIPSVEEMKNLLQQARKFIPDELLWVNPDCGLKTRNWSELRPSLANMVSAAKLLRKKT